MADRGRTLPGRNRARCDRSFAGAHRRTERRHDEALKAIAARRRPAQTFAIDASAAFLQPPRSRRFLALYALATAGGVIGYLPLLTVLLPMRVATVAGDARIGVLTAAIIAGATAASGANILFGALSDRAVARGRSRRPAILQGLMLLPFGCIGVALAGTATTLVLAVALFQFCVNALLAPLIALMADEVPDTQKGLAGGLLALGAPVASGVAMLLLIGFAQPTVAPFALIPVAAAGCVLPLLLTRARPVAGQGVTARQPGRVHDLALAWIARLLVQVAGNVLSLYLLYYFESVSPGQPVAGVAALMGQVLTLSLALAVPVAVTMGRLSDRTGRRKPFLLATAAAAAAALAAMGLAEDAATASWAFGAYAAASAAFLALHAGFTVQLLPDPRHRGRDLGLINLTNTLPALAGPLLTWALATPQDFDALMFALAALTLAGGLLLLPARGRF